MTVIPLIDAPHQTLDVTHAGGTYTIDVRYDPSDTEWYVNVVARTGDTTQQNYGRRVVVDEPITRMQAPAGTLYCRRRNENSGTELGRNSFMLSHDLVIE